MNVNFCSNTYNKCKNPGERWGDDDFANIIFPNGTCHRLTSDDMDDSTASYIDPLNPDYGLRLHFESSAKCNSTHNYALTVDVRCEDDVFNSIPRMVSSSVA